MYTILTTGPGHTSGNVGDFLITESALELISRETGIDKFQVFFRGEDLTSRIDVINESKAVLMPGFGLREPLYPDTYGLVEDLSKIRVPLVPLAAGWKSFPGDALDSEHLQYSDETCALLKWLMKDIGVFTTRDVFTTRVLERHGISPAKLVGDFAWYRPESLGQTFRRVYEPQRIVFTTPHSGHYHEQSKQLAGELRVAFPKSELICAFHSRLNAWDRKLSRHLEPLGYEIKYVSHEVANLDFYSECDLHVGYRLHGHLAFLRQRIPSVLIHEDGRSVACTASLGLQEQGGFDAFRRRMSPSAAARFRRFDGSKVGRLTRAALRRTPTALGRMPNYSAHIIAPADNRLPQRVIAFVQEQLATGFASYDRVAHLFDSTWENKMRPILRALPGRRRFQV